MKKKCSCGAEKIERKIFKEVGIRSNPLFTPHKEDCTILILTPEEKLANIKYYLEKALEQIDGK